MHVATCISCEVYISSVRHTHLFSLFYEGAYLLVLLTASGCWGYPQYIAEPPDIECIFIMFDSFIWTCSSRIKQYFTLVTRCAWAFFTCYVKFHFACFHQVSMDRTDSPVLLLSCIIFVLLCKILMPFHYCTKSEVKSCKLFMHDACQCSCCCLLELKVWTRVNPSGEPLCCFSTFSISR